MTEEQHSEPTPEPRPPEPPAGDPGPIEPEPPVEAAPAESRPRPEAPASEPPIPPQPEPTAPEPTAPERTEDEPRPAEPAPPAPPPAQPPAPADAPPAAEPQTAPAEEPQPSEPGEPAPPGEPSAEKAPAPQPAAPDASEPAEPAAPVGQQIPLAHPAEPEADTSEHWVRYGAMLLMGRFSSTLAEIRRGTKVILLTERGMELGQVVGACALYGDPMTVEDVDPRVESVAKTSGPPHGHGHGHKHVNEILRIASAEDLREVARLEEGAQREFECCARLIREQGLPMKLVHVEHLFGGDRIIFYFLADGRVDFRQLVRDLAKEYQTRIEMRQIGVRDEARLLADYERCGQYCCCRQYLKALAPVNMKMAKVQKATLDPAKISGRCGRLMCCLRYEDKTYGELKKRLPKRGTRTITPDGPGAVVNGQILTQLVQVYLDSGQRSVYGLELLSFEDVPPPPEPREDAGRRREPRRRAAAGGAPDVQGRRSEPADADAPARRSKRRRRRGRRRSSTRDTQDGGSDGRQNNGPDAPDRQRPPEQTRQDPPEKPGPPP